MPDKIKIFLVDDQKIANFITQKLLQTSNIDCEVLAFDQPIQALDAVEKDLPNFIFLDLNMPKLNGWQFLEQMQKNITSKVIILTSSSDPADVEKAKDFPQVISYQTKPPSREILQELILG
ncbi:MAG TPA: response regulator [Mesonia sp.]|nr:response regulator [Mesonia sp.]HIO26859.1 response regulator [Flavobacteriaceae bacterium]